MKKLLLSLLLVTILPLACASVHSIGPTTAKEKTQGGVSSFTLAANDPQKMSIDAERILARADDPLIEDHLWYHRGLGFLYQGKPDKAEGYFRDVIIIHPESVYYSDAKLKLAETLVEQKKYDEAQSLLRQYLSAKPNMYETFEANLLLGRAMIGSGDGGGAVRHFQWMTTSAREDAALEQVTDNYGELDRRFGAGMNSWFNDPGVQYRVAESFFESSQWDQAARRLKKHVLSKSLSNDLKRDAEFLYAKSLARIHQYRDAIELFKKLSRKNDDLPGLAFWMSRTYAKLNEFDKAIAIRRDMVKRYGKSRTAASYLSQIAFLYVDQGRYEKALKEWKSVISMRPGGKLRMEANWFIAWSHYRLGHYDLAIEQFNSILKNKKMAHRYDLYERALYWKGRALAESGRPSDARGIFNQLSGDSGYYSVLARRRLNGDARNGRSFAKESHDGGVAASGMSRLPSPEEVEGRSIHLARALRLDELGLHREAAREIRAASMDASYDPMVMLELSKRDHTYDVGRRVALSNYRGTLRNFPRGGGMGRYIWDRVYPEAYPLFVRDETSDSRVDPRLIWSIMKAESNFRPHVVSPAGAIGLMQLMPSTARRMLGGGEARDFNSHTLFEPEVNIAFGVEYVKKIWGYFPDDHVSVIASYNAGEEAAQRWLDNKRKLAEKDIEQYVEEIPYAETCLYVKRVLSNYWTMQRLYN